MAQRRMFSKDITSSSRFLMMPSSSQSLYFHLGMNADDDGFCEHFMVMRMTGSQPDDLAVLQAKGFVHIFDEKVLVILDWKMNNYLRSDRYTPSRYITIYKDEISRINTGRKQDELFGIPDGRQSTTEYRIGKDSIGNNKGDEEIKNSGQPVDIPSWLNLEKWKEWKQYRIEIRKKLTPSTEKRQIEFLEKNKQDHIEIINQSIRNGWTGLFQPKTKNKTRNEEDDRPRGWSVSKETQKEMNDSFRKPKDEKVAQKLLEIRSKVFKN